jgi:hypothetical protein
VTDAQVARGWADPVYRFSMSDARFPSHPSGDFRAELMELAPSLQHRSPIDSPAMTSSEQICPDTAPTTTKFVCCSTVCTRWTGAGCCC